MSYIQNSLIDKYQFNIEKYACFFWFNSINFYFCITLFRKNNQGIINGKIYSGK